MPKLYFTKFDTGDKEILTELGWQNANEASAKAVRMPAVYQIRDFTHEEYAKLMALPLEVLMKNEFPNI